MGQANHNIRSPQYKGPLPDYALKLGGQIRLEPNEATQARLSALKEEMDAAGATWVPPKLKDYELDVVVTPAVEFIVPMRTTNEHPAAGVPVGEFRTALVDVKKNAIAIFKAAGHIGTEGLVKFDDAE